MRKISLLIVATFILISFLNTTCYAEPLFVKFDKIVQSLEIYALKMGIKLEKDENIKDIVTLGYLNAVNRLKVPFGHLDEKVKQETIEWLSILCWLPGIPPERKVMVEMNLKRIRKVLSQNAYKRALAGMILVPGFAVTSVIEVLPSDQWIKYYPLSKKREEAYNYFKEVGFKSGDIVESLKKGKVDYNDLFAAEWIEILKELDQ